MENPDRDNHPPPVPVLGSDVPERGIAILDRIEEKSVEILKFAGSADSCGHPDRPGNHSGYCPECWALFCEEQGLEYQDDLILWDRAQENLARIWEDPAKRNGVLKRRMQAVKAKLAMSLPIYAKLHLKATQVAASKGDARPAEWALGQIEVDSHRAVDVSKGGGVADGGIKVFVGVKVGNLPPSVVVETEGDTNTA